MDLHQHGICRCISHNAFAAVEEAQIQAVTEMLRGQCAERIACVDADEHLADWRVGIFDPISLASNTHLRLMRFSMQEFKCWFEVNPHGLHENTFALFGIGCVDVGDPELFDDCRY